jgi:hypothetical protein
VLNVILVAGLSFWEKSGKYKKQQIRQKEMSALGIEPGS